jgi:hypothetical protein
MKLWSLVLILAISILMVAQGFTNSSRHFVVEKNFPVSEDPTVPMRCVQALQKQLPPQRVVPCLRVLDGYVAKAAGS